jgi:uncharacterized protein (TIGR00375 family)
MATSESLDLQSLAKWAKIKGIDVLGTGDFTHPKWLEEIKKQCISSDSGLLEFGGQKFMLSAEISTVYEQSGKTHKVHHVVLVPSIEIAEQVNERLGKRANLAADGRPTLTIPSPQLAEIIFEVSQKNVLIPAHAWTPWFSVFGSKSGFDSVEECYSDMAQRIFALETGLSSDPAMNHRISKLDKYALVSNSDSHSAQKIGREANVFDIDHITYTEMIDAIRKKDPAHFLCTYEFFPEEGKYHFDGHRNCGVSLSPQQSKSQGKLCRVCKKPLTIGVMHRVEELADRPEGFVPKGAIPFHHLVPLQEIIGHVMGKGEYTKGVREEYDSLVRYFGTEFNVLFAKPDALALATHKKIADAILLVREGKVNVIPGYDGVFGKVEIGSERKAHADDPGAQKSLSEFW